MNSGDQIFDAFYIRAQKISLSRLPDGTRSQSWSNHTHAEVRPVKESSFVFSCESLKEKVEQSVKP